MNQVVLDVSHHQPIDRMNYDTLVNAGVVGLIARASYGRKADDTAVAHFRRAKEAGIKVLGLYHYLRYNPGVQTIGRQVDTFLGVAGPLLDAGAKDGLIVLDVENNKKWDGVGPQDGPGHRAAYLELMSEWLDAIETKLNRRALIYTGPWWWDDVLKSPEFTDATPNPLWVAHYTKADKPRLPSTWSDYALWQYTGTGRIQGASGVDVDINRLGVSLGALEALTTFRLDATPQADPREAARTEAAHYYQKLGDALSKL